MPRFRDIDHITKLRLIQSLSIGGFAVLMYWEWTRWPNGTALFGPLGLIRYNGADPANLLLVTASLTALLAFPIKPSVATAVASSLAIINWLIWGLMASGIGC